MDTESLITLGYYVSSIGFLAAAVIMNSAVSKFGKSSLGSIFYYLFIGTSIFFVITIFQKLGGGFFGIAAESVDIWWHIMFYLAFFFYFRSLKLLVSLGSQEGQDGQTVQVGSEKKWGIAALVILVIVFIVPRFVDASVMAYDSSPLGQLGLHHFLAFIFAAVVGSYLISAKKNLGMIGKAIANPMVIAMWAFAAQHFWELLFESWNVVVVTSEVGEGIERIFLLISAICIGYAAWRLNSFARLSK